MGECRVASQPGRGHGRLVLPHSVKDWEKERQESGDDVEWITSLGSLILATPKIP